MTGFKLFEAFTLLTKSENAISHLSLQTPYGLMIEVAADGAVDVRLSDRVDSPAIDPQSTRPNPGYRYYIWPDYQTTFIWYKSDWEGNPQDGQGVVGEDELRKRYPEPWLKAYDAWVGKYTQAFEAQECQLGSGREPFPEPDERVAWELEGLLLATYLSLQPGVDAVEFHSDSDKQPEYWLDGEKAAATLERYLQTLGKGE